MIGEDFDFEGEEEIDEPASSRLKASTMERRASWAWRLRLRTLVAVSLLVPLLALADVEEVVDEGPREEHVRFEEGVWVLSAARICAGVTLGGLCSEPVVDEDEERDLEARSIAPLNTSNKDLTSPV